MTNKKEPWFLSKLPHPTGQATTCPFFISRDAIYRVLKKDEPQRAQRTQRKRKRGKNVPPKKCVVCHQKNRGSVKNVPPKKVWCATKKTRGRMKNVPPKFFVVVLKMCHQKRGFGSTFITKNHPAGVVKGHKMYKTNVLKLGVPTLKNSLSTAKNFYILGKSAAVGCNFKTKLPALEAKKNLPESGRVFCHKTGLSLDIKNSKKIISCPAGDVKIAQAYGVVSYSLFRESQAMGYRYCSHLVSQSHKTTSSNPDLGAISCCLQMCAGYFLFTQARAGPLWS